MIPSRIADPAEAVTALILEVFRLNGRLLATGDRLVAGLDLTSARWQVLGAIALSPAPEPVARLARIMGLNRQGVQRIVNELAEESIVAFRDNPHHRRARLVVLTPKGRAAYEAADRLQRPWAQALAQGIEAEELAAATRLLERVRSRLETAEGSGD
jgi:DNA-binding MarR family transcriptional regulator